MEQSVGQVVMPRIDFNDNKSLKDSQSLAEDYNVAGFIIFNGELEQVRDTVSQLQSVSKYPLLFGCDAERGLGQIISGGTKFPFLMAQGAANDLNLLKGQAEITAAEMKYCGINLLFAPVLDVNDNPDNPIINIRSFSDNPNTVASLAYEFINTVNNSGVFCCGKHFPGHGSTDVDSHVYMPELKKNLNELENNEFIPFRKAIETRVDFIMVGHIALPQIDEELRPAIMSKFLIQDILKRDLQFEKIVITDSFRMDALNSFGSEFEIAVKSLNAGCDIILDPKDPFDLMEKIKLEIKESSQCVLDLKKELATNNGTQIPDAVFKDNLIRKISAESVCKIKDGKIDSEKVDINILDVTEKGNQLTMPFTDCLEGNGIIVNSINYISENNLPVYISPFNVINLIVTSVAAWSRHSHLKSKFRKFLEKISNSGTKNILVSLGSPYVIKDLDRFDTIICSYDSIPECQIAVAENLLGLYTSEAKLPVKI